jgi:hypothetical protein
MESQMQVRSDQLVREQRPEKARCCSSCLVEEKPKVAAVDSLLDIPPISFNTIPDGHSHIRNSPYSFLFVVSLPARRLGFGGYYSTRRPRFETVAFCGIGCGWIGYVGLEKRFFFSLCNE